MLEALEHGRLDSPITRADLQAGWVGVLRRPVADALRGCEPGDPSCCHRRACPPAAIEAELMVGGYAFDKPEILEPLPRRMAEHGVMTQLFVDIFGNAPSMHSADEFATEVIDNYFRGVWTFRLPKPNVYYDPRTAVREPPWASLYAKCIVIDDERTLITSANLTDRGQTRNIEAGLLNEDRGFAEELGALWRQSIAARLVHHCTG